MGFFKNLKNMGGAGNLMADANELNARGPGLRKLWAEGRDGHATITGFTDTGERLAGNMVLVLELDVAPAEGDPYAATLRMPIAGTDTSPYAAGSSYAVKIDPEDPANLTFAPAD